MIRNRFSTTARRRTFIERYEFPPSLADKLAVVYEHEVDPERDIALVLEGLRSWYLACLYAKGKVLGMPSRTVDVAWHEMILSTHEYHAFWGAFGRYLHHSPEAAMSSPMGDALARTLRVAEDRALMGATLGATSIPLLFAVDSIFGVEDDVAWTGGDLAALRETDAAALGSRGAELRQRNWLGVRRRR